MNFSLFSLINIGILVALLTSAMISRSLSLIAFSMILSLIEHSIGIVRNRQPAIIFAFGSAGCFCAVAAVSLALSGQSVAVCCFIAFVAATIAILTKLRDQIREVPLESWIAYLLSMMGIGLYAARCLAEDVILGV